MSFIRSAAVALGNSIPRRWKRALKWQLMIPDAGASLELLKRRGFRPRRALDIGGYVGAWTRTCKDIWPETEICTVEAQPDKAQELEAMARLLPGVQVRRALLSDSAGRDEQFNLAESGSSMMTLLSNRDAPSIRLQTQTLAKLVAGTPFEKPDLIKVDVQGAELKVLDGGPLVLAHAEVVILEISLIEEYSGAPLFADVVAYMHARGFRAQDICTIFRNTASQVMNEADVIFVKQGSHLIATRWDR